MQAGGLFLILVQEDSRLNIKLLPKNKEKNKPWWKSVNIQ
jgi:hypothetical protein